MRQAIAIAAAVFVGAQAHAQVSVSGNGWDWGTIRNVPTTFTNGQSTTLSQTSGTRIRMNPSQLAPVVFRIQSTASGTNVNTGSEGRFTVVFGSSIDSTESPVRIVTNGTWTSTFVANTTNYRFTNWVHGAVWPNLHVISVSVSSNTATGVRIEYAQPNGN